MRRRTLLVSLVTLACNVARAPRLESTPRSVPAAQATGPRISSASTLHASHVIGTRSAPSMETPAGRCPAEMALIERPQGPYCIDRWEASLRQRSAAGDVAWPSNRTVEEASAAQLFAGSAPNVKPQGYISGDQAKRACANANKRLCSIDEWVHACRGPERTAYPYGNERMPKACNDRTSEPPAHPVVRLFEQFAPKDADRRAMWSTDWMNDPRLHELPDSVAPTGAHPQCVNAYGVYDLVGNLHEWIDDPEGTFVGGFFMDTLRNGEGCSYRTSAHNSRYHDYSTGFRCCADAMVEWSVSPGEP